MTKKTRACAERESAYKLAQEGFRVKATVANYRWMLLQFDDFFFYGGIAYELQAENKDAGIVIVSRKKWMRKS
jgi:hypothetical protein